MKEASHKGACIGSLCLVVVVVVLGRKWGENIKYEVFFFVVIKVFQKWLLWWLLTCTFQIWSVAYCFKTTFLQQQWSSTFYFSSKRISSRQIPWWMDWTWIWYSVVSLKSRINMWSFWLNLVLVCAVDIVILRSYHGLGDSSLLNVELSRLWDVNLTHLTLDFE